MKMDWQNLQTEGAEKQIELHGDEELIQQSEGKDSQMLSGRIASHVL